MAHRNDPSIEEKLAAEATYHRAPHGLRERVRACLANGTAPEARPRRRAPLFAFAAALATVAALSWTLALQFGGPRAESAIEGALLDAHMRSIVLDNRLVDVPSSDQHTVKPWFTGKIDFAPTVPDLSGAGFVLTGGRLDFVDGRRVAVVTYHFRRHVVNVFSWPAAGRVAPETETRRGFALVAWRVGGMQYWAVSDVDPAQLLVLARDWPGA